jgi:hypothetical protein
MKKLTLVLAFLLVLSTSAFSTQPESSTDLVFLQFLSTRTLSRVSEYNYGIAPVKVTSIAAEIKALDKAKINYIHNVYEFRSPELYSYSCNGEGVYQEKAKAKPFVKYMVYTKDNITYLEVLFGDVSW